MKVSLVIPLFNEEYSINTLYEEIIQSINHDYEIIFIDDGSTDQSSEVIKEIARQNPNVKLIKFRRNFGKSAALNTGFKYASGDIIITLDADLQDDPKEIPRFLEKLKAGWDLVCGWKTDRKDPLSKTLPSKFFNFISSLVFQCLLHDYNCGFKAYQRHVIREIDIYGEMHRYIPALALAKGFKVTEIPIGHRKRKFGKSKYGKERYVRGFLDLLTVKLVTQYIKSPLYLFGGLGTLLSGTGIIIALYLSMLKILGIIYLTNRPLLFLAILLIIVGLQFISIGLMGELLVYQARKFQKDEFISIIEKINLA